MAKRAFSFRMGAAASALAVLLVSGAAPAQVLNLNDVTPRSGSSVASPDFTPNPVEVVVSGGPSTQGSGIDLSTVIHGGAGQADENPSYGFILTSATDALSFYLTPASLDTVLMVMSPDGTLSFNADFLPKVDIHPAPAGAYYVWVGSLSGGTPTVTLGITHP